METTTKQLPNQTQGLVPVIQATWEVAINCEDHNLRSVPAKSLQDPILINNPACGLSYVEGHK
jgi:hypothetical protein